MAETFSRDSLGLKQDGLMHEEVLLGVAPEQCTGWGTDESESRELWAPWIVLRHQPPPYLPILSKSHDTQDKQVC